MKADKPAYTKTQIGSIFTFTLKKELQLEADAIVYYVIEDLQQRRFLLPKLNYEHFGFKPGDTLHCSLERINCKGELFFEPVNPRYERGKSYRFKHRGAKLIRNYFGLQERVICVSDVFGQEQWVRFAAGVELNEDNLWAEVVYIKKGKLFLIPRGHFKTGGTRLWGQFKVVSEFTTERFGHGLLLEDTAGNSHVIPREPYTNYKLEPGSSFWGLISAFSSKGFVYIEPEHPYYKLDQTYAFTVLDTITDKEACFVFVEDAQGEVFKISAPFAVPEKGSRVNLRLDDWFKGKPVWEFLP